MASYTHTNDDAGTSITLDIEPLHEGRSRSRTYGREVAKIPHAVQVTGTSPASDDLDEIEDRVLAASEAYFSLNPFRGRVPYVNLAEIESITPKRLVWRVLPEFESRAGWGEDEMDISFQTVGGTQHITSSIQTRGRYGPRKSNFNCAIGVSDKQVAGCDIVVPALSWGFERTLDAAMVTQAYIVALFYLTGRTNLDAYRGFEPGSTLFLGAQGRRRGTNAWTISYGFSSLPNARLIEDPATHEVIDDTRIVIPGLLDGEDPIKITKYGWDYLWVQYADDADVTAKALIKKPVAAYVEQVYREGQFGATLLV